MAIVSTGQLTLTDLNDTKQLILYLNTASRQQIYDANKLSTDNTAYSPNYTTANLVVTPELFIAGGGGANLLPSTQVQSLKWYEGNQTTTPIAEGTTTKYIIPSGAVGTTAKPISVRTNLQTIDSQMLTCEIVYRDPATQFDITIKANIELVKITNGQKGDNAITAIINNDSDTVPADSSGTSQIITGVTTTVTIYEGATDVTASWSMGTPVVTGLGALNTAYTLTGTPANRTFTLIGTNPMTADVATVTWTLTRSGYSSITKVFTISRIKNGVGGTSPTLYRLIPSSNAIKKSVSNVFSPSNIVGTAKTQVGSGAYGDWTTGVMKFYTTTGVIDANTNWGTVISTSSGVANYTFPQSGTFASNITGVKIELLNGATIVDTQIIPVVYDGATGIDSYFLNVWTPNGDSIKNSSTNIDIQADLYKGAGTIAPTATQWYTQDPTATTASGGNADGGNGWRLINTVANATTAPTLALQANTGTKLTATTYFVKYTWKGLSGETIGSTEASLAVTANNDLKVTIPAFVTNAIGARVYIGTATGVLKYAGDINTSAGSLVISKYDANAEAIPTVTTATITSTQQTLTVRPWAVAGIEGFKCVATSGNKYTGVTVVKDISDPIVVNILGANIFKNGQGTNTLKVQLLQNGVEIPTSGYSFAWSIYNSNGTLNKVLAGTSDTITVLATDITGTGNIVCDVSK